MKMLRILVLTIMAVFLSLCAVSAQAYAVPQPLAFAAYAANAPLSTATVKVYSTKTGTLCNTYMTSNTIIGTGLRLATNVHGSTMLPAASAVLAFSVSNDGRSPGSLSNL